MKIKLFLFLLLAFASSLQAHIIGLGHVTLTGNFTINHLWPYHNNEEPFGSWGPLTVTKATGLFKDFVTLGDTLGGDHTLWHTTYPVPHHHPLLILAGYEIATFYDNIAGADFAGQDAYGAANMSGNGFTQGQDFVGWAFTVPPYDITRLYEDLTGPIRMTIRVAFEDGVVPEGGNTALMFGTGVTILLSCYLLFGMWMGTKIK